MEREALKLALEALESSDKLINGSGNHFGLDGAMDGYYSGCFDVGGNNKLLNKAIAAIKEALAQPAQESYDQTALELCNVCGWKTLIPDDGCLNCERAQPAQEPVAWMCSAFDGEPCEQTNHDECGNPIPLYTAPPQRPWVGLTDAEIWSVVGRIGTSNSDVNPHQTIHDARAIEQLLKEKNT